MGKWEQATVGALNHYKGKTVNPLNTPDATYELYSVPSWDNNYPEIINGAEIGSTKQVVEKGDILLCKINPRINRVWVVEQHTEHPVIASSEWIIVRNKDVDGRYLSKYFQSPIFRDMLVSEQSGIGGSLTRAQPKRVNNYPVPLPPLEVQQQIADVLDRASALIEKRKAQINKLDLLVKSQFVDMFGNPVTNSMGWDTCKLEQLGELNRGISKHRPRNDPKLLGGKYPLIQTGDVANSGLYITSYNSTYSNLGLKQSKLWPVGTLCITIAANIAKTSILSFDACFPDSVVGFSPSSKTNTFFINYWFNFLQKLLEEQAPESAQKNINLKILNALEVICPPVTLQNDFAVFVERVEVQKFLLQKSREKLELNYKSLMQKCFKGEVFNG